MDILTFKLNSFGRILEEIYIEIIATIIILILGILFRKFINNIFKNIWFRITNLLKSRRFKHYKIEDLIFEYYPIINKWNDSIKFFPFNKVKVTKVNTDLFILNKTTFPRKVKTENVAKNKDRVRLNNFRISRNGNLELAFQKTKYEDYLNSNEHLDEPFQDQSKTYRDVLNKLINFGDIETYPLTNICGAGLFTVTSDNFLIISKHSLRSKVYPNYITFTSSGVLNWADSAANSSPFHSILDIHKNKIGIDLKEKDIDLIGFGTDARKIYFQFSFFEKSSLDSKQFFQYQIHQNRKLPSDEKRQISKIPFELENVIKIIFDKIWEPAAEVALLTLCIKKFGEKNVLKSLRTFEDRWQERNTRNEFEYRCSTRRGNYANLSSTIPSSKLNTISKKNVDELIDFIEKNNIKDKHILEIGCGTGRITGRLIRLFPRSILCIEVSPCMLRKHEGLNNPYSIPIRRVNKYFQHWAPKRKTERFHIAICSLVLIHNKNIDEIVSKLSKIVTERIFVMEDITDPNMRIRPLSKYTFLHSKDDLISTFNKYGWKIERKMKSPLHIDTLFFAMFVPIN
jgi:2-polyprenyl-3-methyl-5-hydroxy-6-metoxy-1,4-benzoquinol methylase